jgi:type IV secretory pathway TraG/TraD family ATPase VirD4
MSWNPLDTDDDEFEIAARFAAVSEMLSPADQQARFWIDNAKRFIQHAVGLLRLTNSPGRPPSFVQVHELAAGLSRLGAYAERIDANDPRTEACLTYFLHEWIELDDEVRTGIQAHITPMVGPFLLDRYRSIFSGRSSPRISEMIERGKILYVHMPVADEEAMARIVATFVKLEYFREVLRRRGKSQRTLFFCDEFQVFATFGQGRADADFFERSRESRHANIIATQNLAALYKQVPAEAPVTTLLGQTATKIFLRNNDAQTNKYASEIWGKRLARIGGGASAGHGMRGLDTQSSSGGDQDRDIVKPQEFTGLAIPNMPQCDHCETLTSLGAREQPNHRPVKLRWRIHPLGDATHAPRAKEDRTC